jgi:hypothetical protein
MHHAVLRKQGQLLAVARIPDIAADSDGGDRRVELHDLLQDRCADARARRIAPRKQVVPAVQDHQFPARRYGQVEKDIVIKSPQRERRGRRGQCYDRRNTVQRALGPFKDEHSRACLRIDAHHHVGQVVPAADLAGDHRRDPAPERHGPCHTEAATAVAKAFDGAGIGPKDLSLVELQDNTVYYELAFPEDWGLCEPGEAEHLLEKGETTPTGRLPINPSGGFQSFGEATTAQGLFQICELGWQLRGEAGERQVPDAKVGLGQTLGLGGNATAVVLKR